KPDQNQYGIDLSSFARSREVSLGDDEGTMVSIPSPEDFILMKLMSRRPLTQDYQDMFTVMLANYETLDWSFLRERARDLEISPLLDSYKHQTEQVRKKKNN